MNPEHEKTSTRVMILLACLLLPGCTETVVIPLLIQFEPHETRRWETIDHTQIRSNWDFVDGVYRQSNDLGSTPQTGAFDGIVHVGSNSLLEGGEALRNLNFSADLFINSTTGDECGVIWRYVDDDNYYRFSTSFRDGFSWVQKKTNGKWSMLAKNARGVPNFEAGHINVLLIDDTAHISVNGESLFAFQDTDHAAGTVGFYARNNCIFDNLSLTAVPNEPIITILEPANYSPVRNLSSDVKVFTKNIPEAATVHTAINGNACDLIQKAPQIYQFRCSAENKGVFSISTRIMLGEKLLAEDIRYHVTFGGITIATMGDSNTNGRGDTLGKDGYSASGRRVSLQGYQSNLEDLIAAAQPALRTVIYNAGIVGDQTQWMTDRVDGLIQQHQEADWVLLMAGTNDVLDGQASGLGCAGSSCKGTYAQHLQLLIDRLNEAEKTVFLALIPPLFGDHRSGRYAAPASHPKNALIREYNRVAAEQIAGYEAGPDFYDTFLGKRNRSFLFADLYHPNGLGVVVMAAQWRDALLQTEPELPYLVENLEVRLDPDAHPLEGHAYQQNLLELGDQYLVDAPWLIESIPTTLENARWIMTVDAHRTFSHGNYLTMDVGHVPVDLWVAYPSAFNLPSWLAAWQKMDLELLTDHPTAGHLTFYHQPGVTGQQTLGGAAIEDASGSNYVVAVLPRSLVSDRPD